MERLLVFDQQVRELSGADVHANGLQEVEDFWFTHARCVVKRQGPCSDSGSKLTSVARWKRCQIRPFLAGRGVFLFAERDILGAELTILDDHVLIAAFPGHRQGAGADQP